MAPQRKRYHALRCTKKSFAKNRCDAALQVSVFGGLSSKFSPRYLALLTTGELLIYSDKEDFDARKGPEETVSLEDVNAKKVVSAAFRACKINHNFTVALINSFHLDFSCRSDQPTFSPHPPPGAKKRHCRDIRPPISGTVSAFQRANRVGLQQRHGSAALAR
jgi:hypothetical protein